MYLVCIAQVLMQPPQAHLMCILWTETLSTRRLTGSICQTGHAPSIHFFLTHGLDCLPWSINARTNLLIFWRNPLLIFWQRSPITPPELNSPAPNSSNCPSPLPTPPKSPPSTTSPTPSPPRISPPWIDLVPLVALTPWCAITSCGCSHPIAVPVTYTVVFRPAAAHHYWRRSRTCSLPPRHPGHLHQVWAPRPPFHRVAALSQFRNEGSHRRWQDLSLPTGTILIWP